MIVHLYVLAVRITGEILCEKNNTGVPYYEFVRTLPFGTEITN
jgi:hypothetical protein